MRIGDIIWETHTDDRVEFRAGPDGHHAFIFGYTALSPAEIESVAKSPFAIGLIEKPPAIYLLYECAIGGGFAPYSIHMQSEKHIPDGDAGSLDLIIIQPETGRLAGGRRSMRYNEFFSELNTSIRRQANKEWSQGKFDSALAEFDSYYERKRGNVWADTAARTVLVDKNSYALS